MTNTHKKQKKYLPLLTNVEIAEAAQEDRVLVLPLGTVESNGPHQLLGCDFIVAERLAEVAVERTNALRMPTFHYGISELHQGLPGTFAFSEALYSQVLSTLLHSAAANGFKRILVLNCHRHNHQPLEILARQLRREVGLVVAVIDPLEVVRDVAGEEFKDDSRAAVGHGGEPLISLITHLNPDDVRMDLTPSSDLSTFGGLSARSSTRFHFQGSSIGLFPFAEEINAHGAWADLSSTNQQRGGIAFDRLCDFTAAFLEMFASMQIQADPHV